MAILEVGNIQRNELCVDDATIGQPDLMAYRGIIYAPDQVILPKKYLC